MYLQFLPHFSSEGLSATPIPQRAQLEAIRNARATAAVTAANSLPSGWLGGLVISYRRRGCTFNDGFAASKERISAMVITGQLITT